VREITIRAGSDDDGFLLRECFLRVSERGDLGGQIKVKSLE
jgi:hypothetical protein